MSEKRFVLLVLGGLLAVFALFSGAVYAVDPYMLFHGPVPGLSPVINEDWKSIQNDEIYKNPGIAAFFPYDAVILGSSVTENYRASWFDRAFGCRTVKLSYSNAKTKNFDIILDRIYEAKGGSLKKVFLGLDTTILNNAPQETSYPLPDLVYNRSLWDLKEYFLNKDVYCETAEALRLNWLNDAPAPDDAYRWEGKYRYGRDEALKNTVMPEERADMLAPDSGMKNCLANLANITRHIEAHPETGYYIFFSPYSILYWDLVQRSGLYEQVMFNTRLAVETLLKYENVKVFYFQDEERIITDLDNYMDFIHFSAKINEYMVRAMAGGRHVLTRENYMSELRAMRKIAESFDFTQL